MTTSGTQTFNPAVLFIVRDALINCGAIDENEEPGAHLYESGIFKLNSMVKTLEATGLHVWAEEESICFLQPLQARYVIGGSAPNAHTSDADSWFELTLLLPAIAGATTITLEAGDGALVTNGMNIGVVDNDGVTEWFTVSGAPAGDVVTLSGPLLVAVDAGNYALAYTSNIPRPLKVPKARLLTLNGLNETPMTVLSRQEYMDLPDKGTQPGQGGIGTPTQFFYSPRRDDGFLYVWPTAQTSAWAVRFTGYRSLQDFLLPDNTMDFPQEWILPLTWNLSQEMAPGYGVPDPIWNRIQFMAEKYAVVATSYDRESEDIQFGMNYPTGQPG